MLTALLFVMKKKDNKNLFDMAFALKYTDAYFYFLNVFQPKGLLIIGTHAHAN